MFSVTRGFNFAKSLKELESLQREKLNDERNNSSGNAKSDVILFIPYQSDVDVNDREYCIQQLKQMHEKVPGNFFSTHFKKLQATILNLLSSVLIAINYLYSFPSYCEFSRLHTPRQVL